jgi:hypothetical protein
MLSEVHDYNLHDHIPYTDTASLIAELRREMLEVTAESMNPWWPLGGYFGQPFAGLPEDPAARDSIKREVMEAFNATGGFPVEKVDITDDGLVLVYGDSSKRA